MKGFSRKVPVVVWELQFPSALPLYVAGWSVEESKTSGASQEGNVVPETAGRTEHAG